MLDADDRAGVWVRPPRDVAGCKDAWRARPQISIDKDVVIGGEACLDGNFDLRGNDKVRRDLLAILPPVSSIAAALVPK
jgi:hypothetical protein